MEIKLQSIVPKLGSPCTCVQLSVGVWPLSTSQLLNTSCRLVSWAESVACRSPGPTGLARCVPFSRAGLAGATSPRHRERTSMQSNLQAFLQPLSVSSKLEAFLLRLETQFSTASRVSISPASRDAVFHSVSSKHFLQHLE